jgi:Protein of unknown function (DUF4038)
MYSKLASVFQGGQTSRAILLAALLLITVQASSQHFSRAFQPARLYGVHEITLVGTDDIPDPFDTHAEITFFPPGASATPLSIPLFFDGGRIWRGRAYIATPGRWTWHTQSRDDSRLDNRTGSFIALDSDLPGKLRKHPANPKAFADERGQTFLNIADTAYYLFSGDPAAHTWQEFVREDWDLGIRMLRGLSLGEFATGLFAAGADRDRLNLTTFHRTDHRLQWMLQNYPDMYVEFILFQFEAGWKKDESLWASLTPAQKERILRQYVGRFAAYPQILWEIHNDLRYEPGWNNTKAAREIGRYLKENDPWGTFITTGAYRDAPFPFPDDDWVSFIHLETLNALAADQLADYAHVPMPVFNGEDRYEEYRGPAHPQYYYRRLMWAWLLSGGSATYGQRWHDQDGATLNQPLTPYSQTGYRGLHSVKLIRPFFEDRNIDTALFRDADGMARDANHRSPANRPQTAAQRDEALIVYHPNSSDAKHGARADAGVSAGVILDLSDATGIYRAQWFNALDGRVFPGGRIRAGGTILLRSPWRGVDAILHLYRPTAAE